MNLYIISQTVNQGYDTYDSAIVAATNEETAKGIRPGSICEWCEPGQVQVKLIGSAAPGVEAGVVLASFNAG